MSTITAPKGNETREAIDALKGYVYQIYQSALAWIELEPEELLFLEVAEDYVVVANDALNAVQVKETAHNVTINSDDIITSIDSFVELRKENPELQIRLRHLTTSRIGKEKSLKHRIGEIPTLEAWRNLAKTGDIKPLRKILDASKLSKQTKKFIGGLNDSEYKEKFLKRIHFDCGALSSKYLLIQLQSKLSKLILERGGVHSQVDNCLNSLLVALLKKVTQKSDRYVEKNELEKLLERATHIPVNRAQFEAHNRLINNVLSASIPQDTNLTSSRLSMPKPIDEVPFPIAMAARTIQVDKIISSLAQNGVSWIFGAAGVGKTVGAQIVARRLGGSWVRINLRGLKEEQVDAVLSSSIDSLTKQEMDGFLVDDFECQFEPYIIDKLLYLRAICTRLDKLLLFTSPKPPSSDFLFSASLSNSIEQKFAEFSEEDIAEILTNLGVEHKIWAKYIHLVSGGGHPQLAMAAIQSMQNNEWDTNEIRTMNSLLIGNPAIEQVRSRTRKRLLDELSDSSRRLLERLSLKSGGFQRNFVLDMAQVEPAVPDGGIVFDQLIGSWVDQQEQESFSLSPLLSNFAFNTLTDAKKREINFEIANSLTTGSSLDPIDANAALIAALNGKNTSVITKLCMAVFSADQNTLEMIAPHLMMFTLMRTDAFAYKSDPFISMIFRGSQLLLACQQESKKKEISKVLNCFQADIDRIEIEEVKSSMLLLVYGKLLLSETKFGAIPMFWNLLLTLDGLIENQNELFPSMLKGEKIARNIDGISIVGYMFANQMRQIKLISELVAPFKFLDSCGKKLRDKLLYIYSKPDFELDTIVSGAWLNEHDTNTIDPLNHSKILFQLERFSKSWEHTELAVCCRKYNAIIIDEYGGDKTRAIEILDKGLELYGETNSQLIREKAKVLYRAEDHKGSLELSKILIEEGAPLSNTEKAFLGRDAAVSAEKQGDFELARRYYKYGSNAAAKSNLSSMEAMQVGLMADAALASWHAGDREICLREFIVVLQELESIAPKSSLRASHCHATCRHALLWLQQEASGEKRLLTNGEETVIYPGVISNPEPHSEIGERKLTSIEIAWYMLASIENFCYLNIGITQNIESFLPNGEIFEGQVLLTPSKMSKALALNDAELFVSTAKDTIAILAYFSTHGGPANSFNMENVTYGSLPIPTSEKLDDFLEVTEQLVLCFASNCVFSENIEELKSLIAMLQKQSEFKVRKEFLGCLQGQGSATDYNTSMAFLLAFHNLANVKNVKPSPVQVFQLVLNSLEVAAQTKSIQIIASSAFNWLNIKWTFTWKHQRFQLKYPSLHEEIISQMCNQDSGSSIDKVVNLMLAILPTLGISNESQLNQILKNMKMAGT